MTDLSYKLKEKRDNFIQIVKNNDFKEFGDYSKKECGSLVLAKKIKGTKAYVEVMNINRNNVNAGFIQFGIKQYPDYHHPDSLIGNQKTNHLIAHIAEKRRFEIIDSGIFKGNKMLMDLLSFGDYNLKTTPFERLEKRFYDFVYVVSIYKQINETINNKFKKGNIKNV